MSTWLKENVSWPGAVVATATLTYTITTHAIAKQSWYVSGELVGAGGMLLAVVMVASLQTHLTEWREMGRDADKAKVVDNPAAIDRFVKDLSRIGSYATFFQFASTAGAIGLAIMQVHVEHDLASNERFWTTAMMAAASTTYVGAVATYCRMSLQKAKRQLFLIERGLRGDSSTLDWDEQIRPASKHLP